MSDLVERLTALSEEYRDHDPDVVAFTAEAAAENTRLRATVAAAQEREQRMREALEAARGLYQVTHIHAAIDAALGEPQ